MPAEVTVREDGTAEMAYFGKRPWHGLGQELNGPATAEEAIQAAQLDWEVETIPVYVGGAIVAVDPIVNQTTLIQIPEKRAIRRVDTGEVFNVLGTQYTPVQNRDAFKFFDGVVSAGEAVYHTAGSLKGGRRVWILAKLPGTLRVTDQDVLEKYILLCNGHDGSQAFTMKMTPVRVVCSNTLAMALDRRGDRFWTSHTTGVMNRVHEARDILGLAEAYFELFMQGVNRMAEVQMQAGDVTPFLFKIFGLDETKKETELKGSLRDGVARIRELFDTGMGNDLPGVRGTKWAMYNAVTEYVDHARPVNGDLKTYGSQELAVVDRRIDQAWFGRGEKLKQSAFRELVR